MQIKISKYIFCLLLILNCISVSLYTSVTSFAQELSVERNFDEDKIETLRNDEAFEYIHRSSGVSILEWINQKLADLLEWIFGNSDMRGYSEGIFNFFKWLILALAILFVLRNILGIQFTGLFRRSHELKDNIWNEALEENINEIDFDAMIKQYLKEKDYRYVVRLYYLKALKNLSDQELIKWEPYKTNREYQYEIKPESIKQEFGEITSLFNHVWYGEFEINESQLNAHVDKFESFIQSVKRKQLV